MRKKSIGFIVNPVAGMGGRVGLKGSDGKAIHRRALELGALPVSPGRAKQTLEELAPLREYLEIVTWPGEMGADICTAAGFTPRVIGSVKPGPTSGQDTFSAAKKMADMKVDLILFTGGDGTAGWPGCNAEGRGYGYRRGNAASGSCFLQIVRIHAGSL